MTRHDAVAERLRRAFESLDEAERSGGSCPAPETIWDAVHAQLDTELTKGVVHHVAGCPSCAHDWRLAMRSGKRESTVRVAARPRWSWLGAAAALLLGVALVLVFRSDFAPGGVPTYRAPEEETILSLVPEDESLPKEDAVLRWSPVGGDARYTVEIDTLDLTPVVRARDVTTAEYRIPGEALERLDSGEVIVWTVEARLIDGRRIKSKAFRHRID